MPEQDYTVSTSTNTQEQSHVEVSSGETHIQAQLRLAGLIRDVSLALIQSTNLDEMTQQCAEILVHHFDAAFARIWTLNSENNVLELQASAGMYTHLDGPHGRVPVGTLKIGLIASERRPHLTNEVIGDERVSDQAWARHEGMVAFAGYPLLIGDHVVGVMALFARHSLSPSVLDALASIANTLAIGIDRKQGEQERLRLLHIEQQGRHAAEAAHERLTSILDHLTDGFMIFDHEWCYRYINPFAAPFTGKPPEDLLGKNVWQELPALVGSPFYHEYQRVMTEQESVDFRAFSTLLNHWFDVRAYPIPDGIAVYFRQVTDLVQAEQERARLLETTQKARAEAEAAQQRVTSILESITDAFFALDQNWCFTYLNLQSEPLLQQTREQLLGKNIWEEFPEAVGSTFYEKYHLALEQQVSVFFEEVYPPLNTWFEVRAYPVPDGLSVYFHNINERKVAEQERERLLHLEQEAHAEAESALAIRNAFLSSVSHDLKTPLASIKANLQLVQRRMKREQEIQKEWVTERLEAMERAITKMTGMIDDLLDLTRLRALQHSEDVFLPLDLLPLIRAAIVEQQATTRRHRLILTSDGNSLPVHGNAIRLDRVMANLLGNAIKYSPEGGDITIMVKKEQQGEQAWARLSITDPGIGIPASDLPHIFTPFQRASNVTSRIQGTGIGLASVAQVIEQHQGTLTVTSDEGQGSCFTVHLPLVTGKE